MTPPQIPCPGCHGTGGPSLNCIGCDGTGVADCGDWQERRHAVRSIQPAMIARIMGDARAAGNRKGIAA